jgi:hypothetical protein
MLTCARIARQHVATAAAIFFLAKSGLANDGPRCGESGQPWVSVTFSDGAWNERFEEEAFQDLKAGLASRGIETCLAAHGPEKPPAAAIVIGSGGAENVNVTVEIRDAVTEKWVSRDVNLASMPADGRALAIAVAADELVWASWAEVAYKGAKRRATAPPQVVTAVERAIQPTPRAPAVHASPGALRLGAQFAVEHFGRGLTLVGADVSSVVPLAARFRLNIAVGARKGLVVVTPEGRVQSTAANLTIDGSAVAFRGANAELGWAIGFCLTGVHLQGEAGPGTSSHELNGVAVFARTGPKFGLHLSGPLGVELGLGFGAPLRAVEAADTGKAITGASGLEESATLSLLGEL